MPLRPLAAEFGHMPADRFSESRGIPQKDVGVLKHLGRGPFHEAAAEPAEDMLDLTLHIVESRIPLFISPGNA